MYAPALLVPCGPSAPLTSCLCRMQLERQMERLEITMATLEAKLGSIAGLETVTAADYVPGSVAPAVAAIPADTTGVLPPPPPPPPPSGACAAGPTCAQMDNLGVVA
jgi:hypothetical protein